MAYLPDCHAIPRFGKSLNMYAPTIEITNIQIPAIMYIQVMGVMLLLLTITRYLPYTD